MRAEEETATAKRIPGTRSDHSNSRHHFNHSQTVERSDPLEHPTDEPNSWAELHLPRGLLELCLQEQRIRCWL